MDKIKKLIKQYDDIKKSIVDTIKEFVENKGGKITLDTYFYIHDDIEIELQSLYIENDNLFFAIRYHEDREEDIILIRDTKFSGDTFRCLLNHLYKNY